MAGALTAITFDDVTVAGAFILGAIAGTIATIALMRTLSDYFRRDK